MSAFHVLMYHEIIKKEDFNTNNNSVIKVNQQYEDILPKPLFVFLEEFEKQMDYLHKSGYVTLKLHQIIEFFYKNKPLPEKSVLITFDDMYKSSLIYAYPILKKYGFSAVGFVVLDWLFNEEKSYSKTESVCLSKGELDKMKDVFQYANHSKALHTRKDGVTALQTIDKGSFIDDVKGCENFVEVKNIYAYPFGVFKEEVVHWLKELGFLLAFTTEGGRNDINTNPLMLHRNAVVLQCTLEQFKTILN
ncbi:polysaccharide deacetylase family protein [Clostridium sp. MSJ-4]|uniref:Polysaccharide deacetylase family protein n=1 Tax=Clostridium simiarum TaxID=2841506 RepID=A0ABS6F2S6_9CLOT|nr:polysaccharide deacetylase family protein [Clostridium simiarum]MBU5592164.1 polysaccharide deacetylase family protein [Clostridium simiarum]